VVTPFYRLEKLLLVIQCGVSPSFETFQTRGR